MSPAAPPLIVCDVDGTLLGSDGRVSPRTTDAIQRAVAAGCRVLFATGRPPWWLDPITDAGFSGVAVCTNGSIVFDLDARAVIASTPFKTDVLVSIIGRLAAADPSASLAVHRVGAGAECGRVDDHDLGLWSDADFSVCSRAELVSEPVVKVLVRSHLDVGSLVDVVSDAAAGAAEVSVSSDFGLVELMAAGVDKAAAVHALASSWGIDARTAVAFGDMPNDLGLFSWAGHPVAMGNAHDDVRAAAMEITTGNDDEGVARVVERWFPLGA
ncbi:HAD family phosphatase [Rathayibacter tritici]|uniref:Uncharacterized protein n=1 Tax=Rathayibacter tritici TaxID=33888 RepID=A0A160KVX4_9MICO|nr:HAD family hydrolase [Rathayibacter tritici]AND17879.1 hypothetical protein A6122_2770 [Rathayibacter tritici]PPF30566.1 HAD family phosphatase [Rathayibacter tritici]PPF66679.1 HAD family phosphatase [Rathayibacter tritici]PPG09064.1 HAD family phosphatase [Rathayibacter tritici]PPI17864.1 HAD family phosphatase [Rathayibacter tritici]